MDVSEHVNTLLTDKFGVSPQALRPDVPLRQLRMDSLALEEMRLLIEDRLGIDLEDVQLTAGDTLGRLVTVVAGKTAT